MSPRDDRPFADDRDETASADPLDARICCSRIRDGVQKTPQAVGVTNITPCWGDLIERFSFPKKDRDITAAGFKELDKDQQGLRKAAAGFMIGGQFMTKDRKKRQHGYRRKTLLHSCQLVTLDADNMTPDEFEAFRQGDTPLAREGIEAAWHTTRSHDPGAPRVRIVIPLARPVHPDRMAVVRRVLAAKLLNDRERSMAAVDKTCFRPSQIVYLPSISRDQEFLRDRFEGAIIDADDLLAREGVSVDSPDTWPPHPAEKARERRVQTGKKKDDPGSKPGLIGAFGRVYPISRAIPEFLPDIYEPVDPSSPSNDRWTYVHGSTSGGLAVYGDKFACSHHATDPVADHPNVNAFDLVRLHLFGELDEGVEDEDVPPNELPSHKAMIEFIERDLETLNEMGAATRDKFDDDPDAGAGTPEDGSPDAGAGTPEDGSPDAGAGTPEDGSPDDAADSPEMDDGKGDSAGEKKTKPAFDRNQNGTMKRTVDNAVRILGYDDRFRDAFKMHAIQKIPYLARNLHLPSDLRDPDSDPFPLEKIKDERVGRPIDDHDINVIRTVISAPRHVGWGLDLDKTKVAEAVEFHAGRRPFNPVEALLFSEKWDGLPRLETLFIDYFKVPDTRYYRELAWNFGLAVVTRVINPGCSMDFVPILSGEQGGGKSSFVELMGMDLFAGKLTADISKPKEVGENLQDGPALVEIGEGKALKGKSAQDIKEFISLSNATYRDSYDRYAKKHPLGCVYVITTNEHAILRDDTGSRRFFPIFIPPEINNENRIDFATLKAEVPQIWAEAKELYDDLVTEGKSCDEAGVPALPVFSPEAAAELEDLRRESTAETEDTHLGRRVEEIMDRTLSAEDAGLPDALAGQEYARVCLREDDPELLDELPMKWNASTKRNAIREAFLRLAKSPYWEAHRARDGARTLIRVGCDRFREYAPADAVFDEEGSPKGIDTEEIVRRTCDDVEALVEAGRLAEIDLLGEVGEPENRDPDHPVFSLLGNRKRPVKSYRTFREKFIPEMEARGWVRKMKTNKPPYHDKLVREK